MKKCKFYVKLVKQKGGRFAIMNSSAGYVMPAKADECPRAPGFTIIFPTMKEEFR